MRLMTLSDTLTVSAQVQPLDLEQLRIKGVSILVCNRPDAESQDQPTVEELALAAQSLDIEFVSIPFRSGEQTVEQVTEFAELLDSAQTAGKKVRGQCEPRCSC